uniref:Chloride channel CLIC-like protein 1 n=1 Tax=Anopheles christyi TaxID=43041 RepID=A0A182K9H2_9DIPT
MAPNKIDAVFHKVDCSQDPRWIKPGALDRWGQQQQHHKEHLRENPDQLCPPTPEPTPPASCSPDITEDQRLALVFYRKLVGRLFARDTLLVDPTTDEFLTTDLSLRISTRQLEKLLDESTTARELNLIVSAVLEQSSKARQKMIFLENQCERLYDFLMTLFESRILYNLLPVVLLIAGCFIVRFISRITRMNSFLVFFLIILSITVCNKWKECNENLARQSLQGMEMATKKSWMNVFGIASRNDGTPSLAICDPLQVLVESMVSIQTVYFKSIFKELWNQYTESTEGLWWHDKIFVGIFILGFVYIFITTILPVGVRSGFEMFGSMVTSTMHSSGPAAAAAGNGPVNNNVPPLPTLNLNIQISDGGARSIALAEMLRQENQRIEIVSEEVAAPVQAITDTTTSMVEANSLETTTTAPKPKLEEVASKVNAEKQNDEK